MNFALIHLPMIEHPPGNHDLALDSLDMENGPVLGVLPCGKLKLLSKMAHLDSWFTYQSGDCQ